MHVFLYFWLTPVIVLFDLLYNNFICRHSFCTFVWLNCFLSHISNPSDYLSSIKVANFCSLNVQFVKSNWPYYFYSFTNNTANRLPTLMFCVMSSSSRRMFSFSAVLLVYMLMLSFSSWASPLTRKSSKTRFTQGVINMVYFPHRFE